MIWNDLREEASLGMKDRKERPAEALVEASANDDL